ncbi:MAG: serine/threonine-protein kinase [Polyangiaceae bacterium]
MAQYDPRQVAGVALGEILAGKYRVERVLGIGGVGAVVAAHDMHLDQTVALKLLLPEALANADAVSRFAREARAAVKIRSEHVARVLDVSTLPNGAPYIVMEYLEGGDLAQWLAERGPLPVELAVEFILHAALAVAEAHALGIVHRDLKPANLFCVRRSDGQLSIKVLDFGISKITGREGSAPDDPTHPGHGVTQESAVMGSPHYMSPEQMRSSKDVDGQTDIWALGVTLFELLTGRPPFQATSLTELAIMIANEPEPGLRSFLPDAPIGLETVIARCLKKDRHERYGNVAEFALALQPFAPKRAKASVERISGVIQAAGLSMSALAMPLSPPGPRLHAVAESVPPVGTTAPAKKRRGRSWRPSFVAAGVGAALLGLLVIPGWLRLRPERAAIVPVDTSPASRPPVDPLERQDAELPEAVPIETLPPAPPTWPPEQNAPSAPSKRSPPVGDAAIIAPSAPATPARTAPSASAPAKATPAAANCTPPWYFDAHGNRLFKKECL